MFEPNISTGLNTCAVHFTRFAEQLPGSIVQSEHLSHKVFIIIARAKIIGADKFTGKFSAILDAENFNGAILGTEISTGNILGTQNCSSKNLGTEISTGIIVSSHYQSNDNIEISQVQFSAPRILPLQILAPIIVPVISAILPVKILAPIIFPGEILVPIILPSPIIRSRIMETRNFGSKRGGGGA